MVRYDKLLQVEDDMGSLAKGLLGGAAAALVGVGLLVQWREAQETRRRKSTPVHYDVSLGPDDFKELAAEVARRTTRVVAADVHEATVKLRVRSNSGLTMWDAEVDFNDYGRISGTYWVTSENDQSPIPKFYADNLKSAVQQRAASHHAGPEESVRSTS